MHEFLLLGSHTGGNTMAELKNTLFVGIRIFSLLNVGFKPMPKQEKEKGNTLCFLKSNSNSNGPPQDRHVYNTN